MKAYLTRPALWFCLIIALSSSQYALVAIHATLKHVPMYWSLPAEALADAGITKYFKDLILVLFAATWPWLVGMHRSVMTYYVWLAGVVFFGLIAYLLGEGYPPLIIAGIRWLIGFHAACGLYMLVVKRGLTERERLWLLRVVIVITAFACLVTAMQVRDAGFSQFGKARLPGIFPVGGTNGYYAFGAALIASMNLRSHRYLGTLCYALCMFEAAASGTRFAVLGIGFLAYLNFVSWVARHRIIRSGVQVILMHIMLLPTVGALGIAATSFATGRGNVLTDQTGQLGRAASLQDALTVIQQKGDDAKYTFGAGIGQGTNTGQILLAGSLQQPDWQILVDNTFITTFLQFGIVGSLFVLAGICAFLVQRMRIVGYEYMLLVLVASVTQNLLEQIFILLPGAVFIGMKVREELLAARRTRPTRASVASRPVLVPA